MYVVFLSGTLKLLTWIKQIWFGLKKDNVFASYLLFPDKERGTKNEK